MTSTRALIPPLSGLLLASLLAAAPAAAQAPAGAAPVVVALDSSRSLSPAESAAAVALARELVSRLPAGAPVALLAFDDEVRWLATAPGGSGDSLDSLAPRGRFTVLNDALVEAVRTLGDGGALVVVSDGKDENSATTLEDVARLAGAAGVRVVAVGAGRADERALRRLALLTGGVYAGALREADPGRIAAEVGHLREEIGAERAAREAAQTPAPAPTPAPTPAPPPPAPEPTPSLWFVALLAALLAGALGFWLARRRPARQKEEEESLPELGTAPGVPLPPAPAAAPGAPQPAPAPPLDPALEGDLLAKPVVRPGALFEISFDETAEFASLPRLDPFERTLVLTEEIVLTVREHGHEARRFRMPPGQAVSIGRDSQRNTLAFQDPTLSSQHFRVVLDDGAAYLVDLGSTNGVYLREERVRSARLRPGDRFRAGLLEFELAVRQQSLT